MYKNEKSFYYIFYGGNKNTNICSFQFYFRSLNIFLTRIFYLIMKI